MMNNWQEYKKVSDAIEAYTDFITSIPHEDYDEVEGIEALRSRLIIQALCQANAMKEQLKGIKSLVDDILRFTPALESQPDSEGDNLLAPRFQPEWQADIKKWLIKSPYDTPYVVDDNDGTYLEFDFLGHAKAQAEKLNQNVAE